MWPLLTSDFALQPVPAGSQDSAPVTGLCWNNKRESTLIIPAKKEGLTWSSGSGIGGREEMLMCANIREISKGDAIGIVLDFCL